MENLDFEKIYFLPGDEVTLKQDLPYKPTMYVVKAEKKIVRTPSKEDGDNLLKGIKCRWFTSDGTLQEAIFNTKDLIHMNKL